MHSGLALSARSDRPAYQQIIDQVRQRVASGSWRSGHELPSIRGLAAELRTSVITVRRAYLDLEREGIIATRQGLGSFVAEGAVDLGTRRHEEELRSHLRHAVERASLVGWSADRLQEALREVQREFKRRTA